MSNIAIIPARGGSKGIPNKNIATLCGRPLIEYSIKVALQSPSIDCIVVSSDSERILEVAQKISEKVFPILRPAELALDESGTEGAVMHSVDCMIKHGVAIDYLILLQPTSPFRAVKQIEESLLLIKSSKAGSLISVSDPIQHPSDFVFKDGGVIEYVCREKSSFRRQDFRSAKFINGSIYITQYEFLKQTGKIYSLDNCVLYDMPVEYSVDIDTPFDLLICEAIMNNAKGKEFV